MFFNERAKRPKRIYGGEVPDHSAIQKGNVISKTVYLTVY